MHPAMGDGGSANVKSGVATPIKYFINCEGALEVGAATAEHGTVTFKEVVVKACGNTKQPALQFTYTSNPGFVGTDNVMIYSGPYPNWVKVTVH